MKLTIVLRIWRVRLCSGLRRSRRLKLSKRIEENMFLIFWYRLKIRIASTWWSGFSSNCKASKAIWLLESSLRVEIIIRAKISESEIRVRRRRNEMDSRVTWGDPQRRGSWSRWRRRGRRRVWRGPPASGRRCQFPRAHWWSPTPAVRGRRRSTSLAHCSAFRSFPPNGRHH